MNKIENALKRTTDTKELIIGQGTVARSAEMFQRLFPGRKAIIIADTHTWEAAGRDVARSLEAAGLDHEKPFIIEDPELYAEWKYLLMVENRLKETDAWAIAVGSGVINDLTKYASHRLNRKYMCVGTAASMDGYTAYGSSITFKGNKETFECLAPFGFILDPIIAAHAPKELAASGYGDLIAKIPAGADWMFADAVGIEPVNTFGWDLVQDGLRETLSDPAAIHAGDVVMTEKLAEGLLMSGFAMQAIQTSRPASGTEHQFSHCWDMEDLCFEGKHVSHGFKVGIGTLASTASIEFLLEKDISVLDVEKCVESWKTMEETENDIHRIFAGKPGHIARALKETRGKYVSKAELRNQLTLLKKNWPALREKVREQILPFMEIRENLKLAGAPYEPEMIGVSRERMRTTFSYMPYMRSRFTHIDVIFRCGLIDELIGRLFGKGGIWEIN